MTITALHDRAHLRRVFGAAQVGACHQLPGGRIGVGVPAVAGRPMVSEVSPARTRTRHRVAG